MTRAYFTFSAFLFIGICTMMIGALIGTSIVGGIDACWDIRDAQYPILMFRKMPPNTRGAHFMQSMPGYIVGHHLCAYLAGADPVGLPK